MITGKERERLLLKQAKDIALNISIGMDVPCNMGNELSVLVTNILQKMRNNTSKVIDATNNLSGSEIKHEMTLYQKNGLFKRFIQATNNSFIASIFRELSVPEQVARNIIDMLGLTYLIYDRDKKVTFKMHVPVSGKNMELSIMWDITNPVSTHVYIGGNNQAVAKVDMVYTTDKPKKRKRPSGVTRLGMMIINNTYDIRNLPRMKNSGQFNPVLHACLGNVSMNQRLFEQYKNLLSISGYQLSITESDSKVTEQELKFVYNNLFYSCDHFTGSGLETWDLTKNMLCGILSIWRNDHMLFKRIQNNDKFIDEAFLLKIMEVLQIDDINDMFKGNTMLNKYRRYLTGLNTDVAIHPR